MRLNCKKRERKALCLGAVAVETAMVIGVYLFMVFLLLIFGLAAFRYTILSDTTTTVGRSISFDASDGVGNCSNLNSAYFTTQAKAYLTNTYGVTNPNVSFNAQVIQVNGNPNECRLTVTSEWTFPSFMPQLIEIPPLRITQEHKIEDAVFRRCNGCATCSSS